jgi:hypothetical protein
VVERSLPIRLDGSLLFDRLSEKPNGGSKGISAPPGVKSESRRLVQIQQTTTDQSQGSSVGIGCRQRRLLLVTMTLD